MASRYVVCRVGEDYSVEDKRSGDRVSSHHSWAAAEKAARILRKEAKKEKANETEREAASL